MSRAYFKHPGISASLLKNYAGEEFSPLQAKQSFKKSTANMVLGSGVHSGLEFDGVINPLEFVESRYDSFRTNDARLWRNDMEERGIEVLAKNDWARANTMIQRVINDPVFGPIYGDKDAKREIEVYTEHYKAMMDVVIGDTVYDYKTCSDARPSQIMKDAYHYGYHLQAYHYLKRAQEGIGEHIKHFRFVFICSAEPYDVVCMEPSERFMQLGEAQWTQANERYLYWKDVKNPPGYGFGEFIELDVPPWATREADKTDDFSKED